MTIMRFLITKISQARHGVSWLLRRGRDWFRIHPKLGLYVVLSTILTVVAIASSVACAHIYLIQPAKTTAQPEVDTSSTITLEPTIIDIDAASRSFSISWFARSTTCTSTEDIINIYYGPCLTPGACQDFTNGTSPAFPSNNLPSTPVFQLNTTKSCITETHDILALFTTSTKMTGSYPWATLQDYPNDVYFAGIHLYAQLQSSNSTVGIIIQDNQWISVNFKLNLFPLLARNNQGLALGINVSRSLGLRIFVIAIIITDWIVSIVFLWITVASIVWPEHIVKELFVIPVTALFAFTSVRANLPGSPAGFGAQIDYYGILPNMILITLSSGTLLVVVLLRRIHEFKVPLE